MTYQRTNHAVQVPPKSLKTGSENKDFPYEDPPADWTPEPKPLSESDKRVLSVLAILQDNFGHKELDSTTREVWMRGLENVHSDLIDIALSRSIQELQYFPKVFEFLERTIDPSRIKHAEEKRAALPEPERHPVPMPPEFKAAIEKLGKL